MKLLARTKATKDDKMGNGQSTRIKDHKTKHHSKYPEKTESHVQLYIDNANIHVYYLQSETEQKLKINVHDKIDICSGETRWIIVL